jgi:RNA polymerase sigma-70 factor, ECF subfamily
VTAEIQEATDTPGPRADETRLLELARGGDEDAFAELAQRYRAELRAHGYRLTGSLHDADDALQEGLLHAWRGLPRFEGRASLRSWLYAIVTNAAIDLIRQRSRRELPVAFWPSADSGARLDPPLTDQPWLEPCPDDWLSSHTLESPETRYEQRESIELAFLVALQHLPPLQRSVLLLREVVGFSAAEIARQLGTSSQSVNSALQRARASARSRLPARSQQSVLRALGDERTKAIVEQYADAMERGDADTLIAMLTQDASWSMPPVPTWYHGHEAIRRHLTRDVFAHRWRHLPARSNGQLAVGSYIFDSDHGTFMAAALDVLTLDGGKIAAVTGFQSAQLSGQPLPTAPHRPQGSADGTPTPGREAWISGSRLFARFGLPGELPDRSDRAAAAPAD